jgi:hypothetical protein
MKIVVLIGSVHGNSSIVVACVGVAISSIWAGLADAGQAWAGYLAETLHSLESKCIIGLGT